MKKFLFAVLALTAFSAQAEDNRNFMKIDAVHYNFQSAPNDKYGFNFQLGREVAPGIKLDVRQEFRNEENTNKTTNRMELGGQYETKLYFVKVGVRGAVGEKFISGDNYEYYSVEPFVGVKVTDQVDLKGSWRHRNAFDSDKHDLTNTYKVSADYKYSPDTIVGVSVGKTIGDMEYTMVGANLTYKF